MNWHSTFQDLIIHKINTFPDLTCVCGHKELLDEVDKVLMLNETQLLLLYDITFQLGDFYVPPLLFHHTLVKKRSCIPTIFFIHKCKFAETHQLLFQEVGLYIPSIKKSKACLVTKRKQSSKQWKWNYLISDEFSAGIISLEISAFGSANMVLLL